MRAVIQRVKEAWVRVEGEEVARIGRGLMVLLGIRRGDKEEDIEYMRRKIPQLRIFEDEEGNLNRSLQEVGGELLLVSQFTLYGDARKGRRPSFTEAAEPSVAKALYEELVRRWKEEGVALATGVFQARMEIGLINDGPVTILLDSQKLF